MNQLLSSIVVAGVLPLLFAGTPAHNPPPESVSSQGQLHTIEAPCNVNSISEYGSNPAVVIMIIPLKLSKECLITLAKSLHQKSPKMILEFFDARDRTLNEYGRGYNDCDQPLSERCGFAAARWSWRKEKWIHKHRVAVMATDGNFKDCAFQNCAH